MARCEELGDSGLERLELERLAQDRGLSEPGIYVLGCVARQKRKRNTAVTKSRSNRITLFVIPKRHVK